MENNKELKIFSFLKTFLNASKGSDVVVCYFFFFLSAVFNVFFARKMEDFFKKPLFVRLSFHF